MKYLNYVKSLYRALSSLFMHYNVYFMSSSFKMRYKFVCGIHAPTPRYEPQKFSIRESTPLKMNYFFYCWMLSKSSPQFLLNRFSRSKSWKYSIQKSESKELSIVVKSSFSSNFLYEKWRILCHHKKILAFFSILWHSIYLLLYIRTKYVLQQFSGTVRIKWQWFNCLVHKIKAWK